MDGAGVGFWHEDFQKHLFETLDTPKFSRWFDKLVENMAAKGRPWFWKEPHLATMLPWLDQRLGDVVYVIPVRNPYDSAVSWNRFRVPEGYRDQIDITAGALLRWECLLKMVLRDSGGLRKVCFVNYERLVANPEEECLKLSDFLDQQCNKAQDKECVSRMVGAVSEKLRRNRSSQPFADNPLATQGQKDLYAFLLRKVDDPSIAYHEDSYPWMPGWRQHLGNTELMMHSFQVLMEVERSWFANHYLGVKRALRNIFFK